MIARVLRAAALIVLLGLAGCAGKNLVVSSVGSSASAADYLGYIRKENGLSPATPDARLEKAAEQQARYMAEAARMVHATRRGRDFRTRMKANGIGGAAAENIAHGGMDMAELFQIWTDSAPHRRNMLDPRFSHFGLASATDAAGKRYWTLVLGE